MGPGKGEPYDIKCVYGTRAETFDVFWPYRKDEVAFWAELAKPYGTKLVNPMCATGAIANGLAEAGFEVVAIDNSPEMLVIARMRALDNDNPQYVESDLFDYCPEEPADIVLLHSGCIHHFKGKQGRTDVFRKVWSWLRPGGMLGLELLEHSMPDWLSNEFTSTQPAGTVDGINSVMKRTTVELEPDGIRRHFTEIVRYKRGEEPVVVTHSFTLEVPPTPQLRLEVIESGFKIAQDLVDGFDDDLPGRGEVVLVCEKVES